VAKSSGESTTFGSLYNLPWMSATSMSTHVHRRQASPIK
jgi:hypothetical protein